MPGHSGEPHRIPGALRERAGGPKHKHLQISASLTPFGCHGGAKGPNQETVLGCVMG